MHDPKQDPGYGVHYVVEPTPGRHTVGSWGTYETLQVMDEGELGAGGAAAPTR